MSGGLGRATFVFDGDTTALEAAVSRGERIVRAGSDRIGGLARTGLAIGFGINTFNSGLVAARRTVDILAQGIVLFNAKLDNSTAIWDSFIKNGQNAREEVLKLFQIAKETPFSFEAVLKGVTVLRTLGDESLYTTENIRLFGDAAAATVDVTGSLSNGFKQTTFWIARFYQALQSGEPIGRATQRLAQLGLLTDQRKAQIELAQQVGASPDVVFSVFKEGLERFRGLQERQQRNFQTQISTFQDNLNLLSATAGRPIFDALVNSLIALNTQMGRPEAVQFARNLAAIAQVRINEVIRWLRDPTVQQNLRAWGEAARQFGSDFVTIGKAVVSAVLPIGQALGFVVSHLNALSRNHLGTFVVLAAAAAKFNRELRLAGGVLTGSVNLARPTRTADGSIATGGQAKQIRAARAVAEQTATDAALLAEQRLTVQQTASANAEALLIRRTDELTAARVRQSLATQQLGAADAKLQQARLVEQLTTANVNRLGGADAVRQNLKGLTVARTEYARATQEQARLDKIAAEAMSAQDVAARRYRLAAARYNETPTPSTDIAVRSAALQYDRAERMLDERRAEADRNRMAQAAARQRVSALTTSLGGDPLLAARALDQNEQASQRAAQASKSHAAALKDVENGNRSVIVSTDRRTRAEMALERQKIRTTEAERKHTEASERASAAMSTQTSRSIRLVEGLGMVAQVAAIAAAAYVAINALVRSITGQSIAANIADLLKYGDVYGKVRREVEEFAKAQRLSVTGEEDFRKAVDRSRQELEQRRARQKELGEQEGSGALNPFSEKDRATARRRAEALFREGPGFALKVDFDTEEARRNVDLLQKRYEEFIAYIKFADEENKRRQAGQGTFIGPLLPTPADAREAAAKKEIEKVGIKTPAEVLSFQTNTERLRTAGRDALNAYLSGFNTPLDFTIFKNLSDEVESSLLAATGQNKLDLSGMVVLGNMQPILARAVSEISNVGQVSEETMRDIERAMGGATASVKELLRAYQNLVNEANNVKAAQAGVSFSERNLADIRRRSRTGDPSLAPQAPIDPASFRGPARELEDAQTGVSRSNMPGRSEAARGLDELEKGLNDAQRIAKDTERAFDDMLQPLRDSGKAIAESASDAAAKWRGVADGMRAQIDAMTRASEKRRRAAEDAIKSEQKELNALQKEAQGVERAFGKQVEAIQRGIREMQKSAQAADRADQATIRTMQEGIKAIQDESSASAKAFADQIKTLSQEQAAIQENAARQAGAYQAILNGTLEYYLRENQVLDEQTQKIIAKWEAELSGARRLKDATSQVSRQADRQQRAALLAFDEQIARARAAGDAGQVAQLTRQRGQYQTRSSRETQLLRDRAAVAQDQLDARAEAMQREAEDVASQNRSQLAAVEERIKAKQKEAEVSAEEYRGRLDAAQKELEAFQEGARVRQEARQQAIEAEQAVLEKVQEEAKLAAEAYRDRIEGQQALIQNMQDEEEIRQRTDRDAIEAKQEELRQVEALGEFWAKFWKARADQNQAEITEIETRATAQKKIDTDRVDAAQKALDLGKAYWDGEEKAAQSTLDYWKTRLDLAKETYAIADSMVTAIRGQKSAQDDLNKSIEAMVTILSNAGLLPNKGRSYTDYTPWPEGTPPPAGYRIEYVRGQGGEPVRTIVWGTVPPAAPTTTVPTQGAAPPPPPTKSLSGGGGGGQLTAQSITFTDRALLSPPPPREPASVGRVGVTTDPLLTASAAGAGAMVYNQNGALIQNATIREDADVTKIADRIVEMQSAAMEQARRRYMKGFA